MVLPSLLALTKLVPLSDQKVSGRPRRATNLSIAIMNELVLRLWRTFRWIALVVKQVKSKIHLLSVVRRMVTCRNPEQSRHVLVKAGFLYASAQLVDRPSGVEENVFFFSDRTDTQIPVS